MVKIALLEIVNILTAGFLVAVDIEKAFDFVNHFFLLKFFKNLDSPKILLIE